MVLLLVVDVSIALEERPRLTLVVLILNCPSLRMRSFLAVISMES
ncbi:hypothetical protein [Rubritalea tangerina]